MINRERLALLAINLALVALIAWLVYTGMRDNSPVYRDAIPENARSLE